MKIAVIGTGISGLLSARLLCGRHDVHVFEADSRVGGHTHSQRIELAGRTHVVDTGFMVFNDRTYPHFVRMLDYLGVDWRFSDMSFGVRCDQTGIEYCGSDLNTLFAQRRNLLRPSFLRMIADVLRFNRHAVELVEGEDDETTLGEFLKRHKLGRAFQNRYLLPMGAAIWSTDLNRFAEFPAKFIVRFFDNHGLLTVRNQPQWKTIVGGSQSYVQRLIAPYRHKIRLDSPVQSVVRHREGVVVKVAGEEPEWFDALVMATHADQSLRILHDATRCEKEILSAFPYQESTAVLHTDTSIMPRTKRAWASWNYHIAKGTSEASGGATVTYDLSRLQGHDSAEPVLVTLNAAPLIDPTKVLRRMTYSHPLFERGSMEAQRRHEEINGANHTFFCGAYWRNGFHEDGVVSALAVGKHFGVDLTECKAASTKASSVINGSLRETIDSGFACS